MRTSQLSGGRPSIFIPDALGHGSTVLPAFEGVHNNPLPPPSAEELDESLMVDDMPTEPIVGFDYNFERLFSQPEPITFDDNTFGPLPTSFDNVPRFDQGGFYPSPASSSGSPLSTTPDSPSTDILPNSVGNIFEDLLLALQDVVSSQDISDLQDLLNAQHISTKVCLFVINSMNIIDQHSGLEWHHSTGATRYRRSTYDN